MLKSAHKRGVLAALRHFKLSATMGADPGVMPSGPEVSHGTDRTQYPPQQTGTSAQAANMPDWLFDNFATYDKVAPGRADGTFGQEVIG